MPARRTPNVNTKFFQAMQYSIARRVLGETLTSFGNEGGGGSKAQGDNNADTLEKRSVELCRQLESVINRQLVRPLVPWNFGSSAPMPTWHFDLEEAEDLEVRLTIDSGLQRMGKESSLSGDISDRYDTPLAEGENPDDLAVPNVSAPMVALRDTSSPSFSEASHTAEAELGEFYDLFNQLRSETAQLYKTRVKEITGSAVPVTGE